MPFYARVTISSGDLIHLAEIPSRKKDFQTKELQTLCGREVQASAESVAGSANCIFCLRKEKERPLARRSKESAPTGLQLTYVGPGGTQTNLFPAYTSKTPTRPPVAPLIKSFRKRWVLEGTKIVQQQIDS